MEGVSEVGGDVARYLPRFDLVGGYVYLGTTRYLGTCANVVVLELVRRDDAYATTLRVLHTRRLASGDSWSCDIKALSLLAASLTRMFREPPPPPWRARPAAGPNIGRGGVAFRRAVWCGVA